MFYVYKITNKINNKIYIGKTNNPYQRWQNHLHYARHGINNKFYQNHGKFNLIHKSIAKYGETNFAIEIIQEYETEAAAFESEKYYILYFKTRNRKFGYNLTNGGEGTSGKKHSEEAKQRMREKATGRKHSLETKEKLKNIKSGDGCGHNKIIKEQIVEIFKLRNEENFTYSQIANIYHVSRQCISKICRGQTWKNLLKIC